MTFGPSMPALTALHSGDVSLPATAPPRLSDIDWRWALPRILLVFIVTRLLVLAVVVAVETTQPMPPEGARADDRPILGSLTAWDGIYYLDIVENGYQADADPFPNYAFFPAYPALVRATSVADARGCGSRSGGRVEPGALGRPGHALCVVRAPPAT